MPKKETSICLMTAFVITISTGLANAGEPSVLDAKAHTNGNGTYSISATLIHKDEGWEHYANKFEVLGPDQQILATRELKT